MLRCFRKHKLKDPKGEEEEEDDEEEEKEEEEEEEVKAHIYYSGSLFHEIAPLRQNVKSLL
jgi:hypothetical protein